MTDFNTTERQMSEIDEKALQTAVDEFRTVHAGNGGNLHASMRRATLAYESAKAAPAGAVAAIDRLERAAMAYERMGKLTRDDEKTRQLRKEAIAELAAARSALAHPAPAAEG